LIHLNARISCASIDAAMMPSPPIPFASAYRSLLHPDVLQGPSVLDRPSPVPRLAGIYAWYFAEVPPGVLTEGCHVALEHTLLYVGIAPKETRGATTRPSERTLHCRLGDHFRGNAEGSTLRLTLGCLLSDLLGIQLRRVGSGRRFTFTNAGEQILDAWMARNAKVTWAAVQKPWEVENALLATLPLPLNLQGNTHPFVPILRQIRKAARARAQMLPIVEDNGGLRRPPSADSQIIPLRGHCDGN
jgi:hypothetical protein